MKRPPNTIAPRPGTGSVAADEVLTLREFGRRLNLASRALCDAQKAGLPTILFGRCKYVLGSDALDWFRGLAERQAGGNGDLAPSDEEGKSC
jgi:hypothetical protein